MLMEKGKMQIFLQFPHFVLLLQLYTDGSFFVGHILSLEYYGDGGYRKT